MAHVVDAAGALGGLEGAVEYGEVLGLDGGSAFDGAGGVDVGDDGVDVVVVVAELDEGGGDGVVDDLDPCRRRLASLYLTRARSGSTPVECRSPS